MKLNLFLCYILLTWISTAFSNSFYEFTVKDVSGKDVNLSRFKGTVSLVTNVASACGWTDSHYSAYSKLQDDLKDSGKFQIIAFPCNQFGAQEPKPNAEIAAWAKKHYDVTYPLMAKIDVMGPQADPSFTFLIEDSGKSPDWNFWKYLVGPDGRVMDAWGPRYAVEDVWHDIRSAVQSLSPRKHADEF